MRTITQIHTYIEDNEITMASNNLNKKLNIKLSFRLRKVARKRNVVYPIQIDNKYTEKRNYKLLTTDRAIQNYSWSHVDTLLNIALACS